MNEVEEFANLFIRDTVPEKLDVLGYAIGLQRKIKEGDEEFLQRINGQKLYPTIPIESLEKGRG